MSSLKNTRLLKGPGGTTSMMVGGINGTAAFNPASSSSSTTSSTAPLADPTAKRLKEELDRVLQDIHLMNCKIAESKGEATPSSATISMTSSLLQSSQQDSSPFVNSLRHMTESERRLREVKESRLQSIETLLERVSEYDRIILAKTAPTDAPPKRRKSIGADLMTLPTHLQVIDRLMDIYNQSKRVAVIRVNGESPRVETSTSERALPPPASSNHNNNNNNMEQVNNLKSQVDSLKQHIEKLHEQLKEYDQKKKSNEQEIKQLTTTLQETERKHTEANEKIQSLQDEIQKVNHMWQKQLQDATEAAVLAAANAAKQNKASSEDDDEKNRLKAEIERLKSSLKSLQHEYKEIEERLSIETSINKSMLNALLRKASLVLQDGEDGMSDDSSSERLKSPSKGETTGNTGGSSSSSGSNHNGGIQQLDVPEDFKAAFTSLDNAIDLKIDGFRREVKLLLKVKETLEGEISSVNLQRDLLQQDLTTLSDAHGAMTAAYHSLSYETATGSGSKSNAETEKLKTTVEEQKKTITRLEGDLIDYRAQLRTFETWPALVGELEVKLRTLTEEKNRYQSLHKTSEEEVLHYKKLTETLKAKIKSIGDGHNVDTKDYLDTFEEVMKEEMMVMKSAFEAKLKSAKEDAEALARRHQQEIVRMQSLSPFPSLGIGRSTK